jgi:hypothetical protein
MYKFRRFLLITALFSLSVLGMYAIAGSWWSDIDSPTTDDYVVAWIVVAWIATTLLTYISIVVVEAKKFDVHINH